MYYRSVARSSTLYLKIKFKKRKQRHHHRHAELAHTAVYGASPGLRLKSKKASGYLKLRAVSSTSCKSFLLRHIPTSYPRNDGVLRRPCCERRGGAFWHDYDVGFPRRRHLDLSDHARLMGS